MNRENVIILLLLAALAVTVTIVHAVRDTQIGRGYYRQVTAPPGIPQESMQKFSLSQALLDNEIRKIMNEPISEDEKQDRIALYQKDVHTDASRTLGLWLAAFFTLAIFSFLYRDNPLYKIAEHAFVGISAAYWMVLAYWQTVVPNLLGKLWPQWTKFHILPGLDVDEIVKTQEAKSWLAADGGFLPLIDYAAAQGDGLTASTLQLMNMWSWIPMVLGIMLLWRLAPAGAWIARWPLAFILGITAGFRLTGFLEADFLQQIKATVVPFVDPVYAADGSLDFGKTFYASMNNVLLVLGVACGLIYFFFSLEHRGVTGKAARIGIWVLMITFGAGFGYTVMGRVALLAGRIEFLVRDWLNLIPIPL